MAYEKDCDIVNTLKGTEYIRALAEDGSTVRIPVTELGKVMAQVMPVATSENNGLMSTFDKGNLRIISFSYNYSKKINLGKVNGLIRFKLWSYTSMVGLYLVSNKPKSAIHIAGHNISDSNYSFSFDESDNLILESLIDVDVPTHFTGIAECIV